MKKATKPKKKQWKKVPLSTGVIYDAYREMDPVTLSAAISIASFVLNEKLAK